MDFASPAILSNRNVTLGLKKHNQGEQKGAAHLGIQPEPSGPSPAGAEGARAKSDLTAVREGTWCGSSLWLSLLHPKSTELLELTNFLSPTDVPWKDLAPPDAHSESVRSFS